MTESRFKNSIANISSGIIFNMIILVFNFLSRTIFIRILGDDCLGLNGLFTSLLSMFSLAELGIGQAITYYMYKPIAENDEQRLCTLVNFYKLCYRLIGIAIFVIGLLMIPFFPRLIDLNISLEYCIIIYILYLLNTVVTYLFFSYPQTVLIANQKQFIVNKNQSYFAIITFITDVLILVYSKNFILYLIGKLVILIFKNIVLAYKAIKLYPYIKNKSNIHLTLNEIKEMFKDVYAIFVVKLSSQLFNSTDNIFISALFGTIITGYNSNYLMIINAVYGVIGTIIYSFGASIGNLYATESIQKTEDVFSKLNTLNCWVSCICMVCLFLLLNPFISVFWGEKYVFSTISVALMCASFYQVSSLYALFSFRQSMGLFRYCIYTQLIAAIVNILLDVVLGKAIGINGIFLATVLANIFIAIFPYVRNLYVVGFKMSPKACVHMVIKNYCVCIFACLAGYVITSNINVSVLGLLFKGVIALIISNIVFILANYKMVRKVYQYLVIKLKRRYEND